ncbi:MAG: DUF72 domain-containing protein [Anaerolineae bacterium]|nr:DUF72 domain-containing protein [Anaerolineae bacterium]
MAEKQRQKSASTSANAAPLVTGSLYAGCAIWAYDGWANNFFPAGTPKDARLEAYARRLSAVEINATFYAMPAVPVVKKWAEATPESFRFSPKFPKTITHTAQLVNVGAQTTAFIGTMRVLGARLGPLMLQLPPAFAPAKLPLLQRYLDELPDDLEIAVEVRHPDWFTEENGRKLDAALAATNASRVVFDVRPAHNSKAPEAISAQEKKPDVPLIPDAAQPFVIVRYISSPVLAENEAYFAEWIPRLIKWLGEGKRVYFYAHCPLEELSPTIARIVHQRVAEATHLPPLPWEEVDKPDSSRAEQLPLF